MDAYSSHYLIHNDLFPAYQRQVVSSAKMHRQVGQWLHALAAASGFSGLWLYKGLGLRVSCKSGESTGQHMENEM